MRNRGIIVGFIITVCVVALAIGGVFFVKNALVKAREEAYAEGHSDGYDEGYEKGYQEGKAEGYELGGNEGYDAGYNDGYDECASKAETAIELAYNEGYKNGVLQTGVDVLNGFANYLQGQ